MKAAFHDQARAFERALEGAAEEQYLLRLYVTGTTPRSVQAITNIKRICEAHLKGRYVLEVVDIYQQPVLAKGEQIIAAPTLIKRLPLPLRRMIGTMADEERILLGLDLRPAHEKKVHETGKKSGKPWLEGLKARLAEAEETLRAIYEGQVDALVVKGPEGEQVFTLKGAETPYRLLLEAMNEGALTLNTDGTVLYCNSGFARMARRPMERIVASTCQEWFSGEQYAAFQELLKKAQADGARGEFTLQTGDGPGLPVEVSVRSFKLGETDGFSVLVTDITGLKRSERALREANERLEEGVRDRTAELTKANDSLRKRSEELASANEELQAQSEELQAQTEEMQAQADQLVAANQQSSALNEQLTGANGQLKTANEQLERKSGELAAANEKLHLHSERLQAANQALEQSRALLTSILEQMPVGVILAEAPSGKLLLCNAALERIFRHPFIQAGCINGYSAYKAFHPDGRPMKNHEHPLSRSLLSGEVIIAEEMHIQRGDGTKAILSVNCAPVRDGQGRITAGVLVLVDFTEHKQMEEALFKAKTELERHAKELEERVAERTAKLQEMVGELKHFSYTITHDMRAPLRAMQGLGAILLEECADCLHPERGDFIRRIVGSASRMDSLITDALNYSKVVRQELELGPVNAGALLRGMVESYPQFQRPRADICIEGDIPLVLANEAGLTQCFSNLLGNAVKFVHPDRVPKVRVWAEGRGDQVRLWFEDNGIGIAKEHQDQIFLMFQRLSKSYEGTGIGLALVRKTVERMAGKTGVESEPGQGSRFWIELKRFA